MNKKIKTNSGFTMMELVVTLALMGVLISFAIPAYNGVSEEMQGKRNVANMQTIREAFFHYFYRMHQQKGRIAHFPPPPENEMKIMDDDWANTPMDSLLSPMAPKIFLQRVSYLKTRITTPFCTRPGMIPLK